MKARFLALAALVLGLASCQQEFNGVAQLGGEVDFQLKVDAAELATRAGVDADVDVDEDGNYAANSAFGAIDYLQGVVRDNVSRYDWNDVDLRYSLEVYDAGADYSNTKDVKPVKDRMVKIVDAYEPVVFDLRLVPGRNYHFVVFADFVPHGEFEKEINPSFEYQEDLGIHHTIGRDLRSIQIKADAINDERCDAYFATTPVTVKHQALTTGDIVLQRPYGKLRVIATDLAELNLNVDPAWVEVTYTAQHPQHFNAVTGDVTGFVEDDYGFSSTYNELFKDIDKGGLKKHFYGAGYDNAKYYSTENADGVKRHTHMTLFTDYILGSNTLGEQTPVQFTMTVYDKANNPIKTTQFNTTIPIERNHLTTIVGNVLTSATEISVTIDDNFANPGDEHTNSDYYQVVATDGYELVKAAMEQYKVILDGGVDENGNKLPITVTIKDFEKYYAELNTRAAQTTYTFPNGTEIDLNGYTLIIENNSDQPLIVVEEGNTLNIVDNSNEDKGEVILTGEGDGAAIQNNGTLNIESVELESETGGSVIDNNGETNIVNSTLNNGALKNNEDGEANIAGSDLNEGSVENNGMTNVNGGDVDDNAITNGTNATIGSYIKNAEGLQAEINAAVEGTANKFTLNSDIEGNITVIQKPNVKITIDGANYKFKGQIKVHSNSNYYDNAALTIKNVNFETSTASVNVIEALENGSQRYSQNITVENCTFTATGEAVNTSVAVQVKATRGVTVTGCTATDMHSLIQAQSCDTGDVKVINCAINGKNGVAFKQVKAATVEGTTITALEYGIRFDGNIDNYGIVVKNNEISAAQPFIVRKMTGKNNTISLVGENTLTSNREMYNIVITNGSDDEAYVAPTGTYTLTGAEDFVVFPYTWEVSTGDELVAALDYEKSKTETVIFKNDIEMSANQSNAYGKTGINILNGQTLDGAGHTFKVNNAGATWDSAISTTGGTIKNITVAKGFRGIFVNHNSTHSEKVILENVIIDGPTYTLNCDQGTYKGLEAKNCTFNGWTSFAETIGEIKFNDCSFGKGAGYKTCVPYRPTTFTNCEFCENFDMYNGIYAMLINCTSNGEALTPANAYSGFADATFIDTAGRVIVWNEMKDVEATTYEGEAFESGNKENALWVNNCNFGGDAAIILEDKTYNAIILENSVGEFKNDVITINNDNSSVMILQNLNLTLAEGKKLIKATNKTYQVFMANITINGEKMTTESMAKYLENVEWYQVVEEI